MTSLAAHATLGASLALLVGCGGSTRRFPLKEPLWNDTDLSPVSIVCRPDKDPPKDDPKHQVCMPEPYESPFAWDGANQMVFRPISRFFAVDPGGEALNVNAFDEVADSAWFVNRIGMKPYSMD